MIEPLSWILHCMHTLHTGFTADLAVPWVWVLPETQQGCSHKPLLFCTSKIRKVYKKYLNIKYEHYSTSEGFVSLFFQQVPRNVVKPTSGKQESTYRVTKNGQDRDHTCFSWFPLYGCDSAGLRAFTSLWEQVCTAWAQLAFCRRGLWFLAKLLEFGLLWGALLVHSVLSREKNLFSWNYH